MHLLFHWYKKEFDPNTVHLNSWPSFTPTRCPTSANIRFIEYKAGRVGRIPPKTEPGFYFYETEIVELNRSYVQKSVLKLKIIKLFSPFDLGDTRWIYSATSCARKFSPCPHIIKEGQVRMTWRREGLRSSYPDEKFSFSSHTATDSQSSKECETSSTLSPLWWHLLFSVALNLLPFPRLIEPLFSFRNSLCLSLGRAINQGIQISLGLTWHLPSENSNLKVSDSS